jgi:uncharacterized membrane protein HdeD (DUF308 family)
MKWFLTIIGVLLLLMGSVWILQGLNILTQGFMAGHIQYTILGVIVDVVGIALLVVAFRRRKPTGSNPSTQAKQ